MFYTFKNMKVVSKRHYSFVHALNYPTLENTSWKAQIILQHLGEIRCAQTRYRIPTILISTIQIKAEGGLTQEQQRIQWYCTQGSILQRSVTNNKI